MLCAVIVVRLFDEERRLAADLSRYEEYRRKEPYRIVPGFGNKPAHERFRFRKLSPRDDRSGRPATTANNKLLGAGYGPPARHVRSETGLMYKGVGGREPQTETDRALVRFESPFRSVVHGVWRQRHW